MDLGDWVCCRSVPRRPHLVHMPLQVPRAVLDQFSFIADPFRKRMHAMVHYLDREIGTVVSTIKQRNLWQESLIVLHADNGGEIMGAGTCGGNNWCASLPASRAVYCAGYSASWQRFIPNSSSPTPEPE